MNSEEVFVFNNQNMTTMISQELFNKMVNVVVEAGMKNYSKFTEGEEVK